MKHLSDSRSVSAGGGNFRRGMATFPHNRALQVFLAMTLYNLHRYHEAMELLLTALAETTSDETIL